MAISSGDLLRIIVHQEYDQQLVLNVFYYEVGAAIAPGLTAIQMAEFFWDHVQVSWRDCVHTSVVFDRVTCENLDGGQEYGEFTIVGAQRNGSLAGQPMAAFVAYPIQLNRNTRTTRSGAKRIVGVVEVYVLDYGVIDAGQLANLQELADLFAEDVMGGIVVVMAPVIAGFPNDNRPVRVLNQIDTATAKEVISTQNSRKRGAGS